MYLQASSPSPGDWCRGPSVCRLHGGPERWTGREPGGSRGARWGQCMTGGLCIETSSQNRLQTRGGKSIIYVFITSLNLGLFLRMLSRCCYMLSYLRSIDGQLRLLSLFRHKSFILISAAFHWQHDNIRLLQFSRFNHTFSHWLRWQSTEPLWWRVISARTWTRLSLSAACRML